MGRGSVLQYKGPHPTRLEISPVPEVGCDTDDSVVVQVTGCGLCPRDFFLWKDMLDMGGGRILRFSDRGIRFPLVAGHEIVGHVHKVGSLSKQSCKRGDRVIVYPWIGCQAPDCSWCGSGDEHMCDKRNHIGFNSSGGFSSFVHVPNSKYIINLEKCANVQDGLAAILPCVGLTCWSAAKRVVEVAKQQTVSQTRSEQRLSVLIIGTDTPGLLGAHLCRHLLGDRVHIMACDSSSEGLDKVVLAGADGSACVGGHDHRPLPVLDSMDCVLNGSEPLGLGAGADVVLDFVCAPWSMNIAFSAMKKKGHLILAGLSGGVAQLSLPLLTMRQVQISGVQLGSRQELREVVDFLQEHPFAFESDEVPFQKIQERLLEMGGRKVGSTFAMPPPLDSRGCMWLPCRSAYLIVLADSLQTRGHTLDEPSSQAARHKISSLPANRMRFIFNPHIDMLGHTPNSQTRTALVTGAASGIGKEICRYLASKGVHIVALDRNSEGLEEVKEELGDPVVLQLTANLTSVEEIRAAVAQAGPVHYLVNCAGVARFQPIWETSEDAYDLQMDINLKGLCFMSIEVARLMAQHSIKGAIVNISSQSSQVALWDHLVYSSSKAGVDHATRILAMELGKYGIRVNAVNPTVVLTELALKNWKPADREELKTKIPLGRLAEPIDVARVVGFLLGDDAAMVTGVTLPVDGGFISSRM